MDGYPGLIFRMFSMALSGVGSFLYRAGWAVSGVLLFDLPPTIFAYSAFFPRLMNIHEAVEIGFFCTATAGLSWLVGRAMAFVLGRINRVNAIGVRSPQGIIEGGSRITLLPATCIEHSRRAVELHLTDSPSRRLLSYSN
jgi:hypothetical protein